MWSNDPQRSSGPKTRQIRRSGRIERKTTEKKQNPNPHFKYTYFTFFLQCSALQHQTSIDRNPTDNIFSRVREYEFRWTTTISTQWSQFRVTDGCEKRARRSYLTYSLWTSTLSRSPRSRNTSAATINDPRESVKADDVQTEWWGQPRGNAVRAEPAGGGKWEALRRSEKGLPHCSSIHRPMPIHRVGSQSILACMCAWMLPWWSPTTWGDHGMECIVYHLLMGQFHRIHQNI